MIKQDIVKNISTKSGIDRDDIKFILNKFIDEMNISLSRGESVSLRGFGTFEILEPKELNRHNLVTGKTESSLINRKVLFKANKKLLNKIKDI